MRRSFTSVRGCPKIGLPHLETPKCPKNKQVDLLPSRAAVWVVLFGRTCFGLESRVHFLERVLPFKTERHGTINTVFSPTGKSLCTPLRFGLRVSQSSGQYSLIT